MSTFQISPDGASPLGKYFPDWKKELGVAREVPPFEEILLWRLIMLSSEQFVMPPDEIEGKKVEAFSATDQMIEIVDGLVALESEHLQLVVVHQEDPESKAIQNVTAKIQEYLLAFRAIVQLVLANTTPSFTQTLEDANRLMSKVGPTAKRNLDNLEDDLLTSN